LVSPFRGFIILSSVKFCKKTRNISELLIPSVRSFVG
jgi:hypothetical protein